MDTATVTRELECKLNDVETLERADTLADASAHAVRLKDERRQLNAKIREQLEAVTRLARAIESRSEVREVVCRWHPDYKAKMWDLRRADNGEPAGEQRAMTAIDLQERLLVDGDSEKPKAPNGKDTNGKRRKSAAKSGSKTKARATA